MVIDLVVYRAVDAAIALQESMREAQLNGADFVEPLPFFKSLSR